MAQYTSFETLLADLQKQVNKSLVEDVAPVVKDVMRDNILSTVYSAYKPVKYIRRYNDGGLLDNENIHSELVSDGTISITNDTPINEEYDGDDSTMSLTEQIIEGKGYSYNLEGAAYLESRDFMEDTREELRQTGDHVEALKNGLRKKGFEVK